MRKVILFVLLILSIATAVAQDKGFLIRVNQDVNLRTGPSIEAELWGHTGPGDTLHVIDTSNGWYKILLDGKYEGETVWLASWLDLTKINALPPQRSTPQATPPQPSFDFFRVYQESLPSVVMLETRDSSGTGFVVDNYGHIVTNAHVVNDSSVIRVEFFDGDYTRGTLIGSNSDSDIAVIKVQVPCKQLRPISFSQSQYLNIGQAVLGIGGPGSLSWDAITGHIIEYDADVTLSDGYTQFGLIKTDLESTSGYSGGPLIDTRGEVIGVTFARSEDSTWSIPSAQVLPLVRDIIGDLPTAIHIPGRPLDLEMIHRFGLYEYASGILLMPVDDGETIDKYGLVGHFEDFISFSLANKTDTSKLPYIYAYHANIIYAVDGIRVNSLSDINRLLEKACPGDYVSLDVYEIVLHHAYHDVPASFANARALDNFIAESLAVPLGSLEGVEAYIAGVIVPLTSWNVSGADIDRIIIVGVDGLPVQSTSDLRAYILQHLGQEVTLNIIVLTKKAGETTVRLYIPRTY